jgi:hypothetical protein
MAHINVEEYYNNYNIFIINDEKGSEYNKIKTEPIIEINESESNYKEKIYENLKYILSKAQLIKSKILKIINKKIKILSKNNLINYYDKLNQIIKKTENFNCLMNTDEFFLELKSLVVKKQKEQNKFNVLKNALNRELNFINNYDNAFKKFKNKKKYNISDKINIIFENTFNKKKNIKKNFYKILTKSPIYVSKQNIQINNEYSQVIQLYSFNVGNKLLDNKIQIINLHDILINKNYPINNSTNLEQNLKSFENSVLEDKIKKIYSYNKYLNYYFNKHSEYELRNK